jgi:hypothetical protein
MPGAPFFRLASSTCNPQTQNCAVRLVVPLEFPGVEDMIQEDMLGGSLTPYIYWFTQSTAPACQGSSFCGQSAICGLGSAGGQIFSDFVDTYIQRSGVNCTNASTQTGNYSIRAIACRADDDCRQDGVVNGLTFANPQLPLDIGCPVPPPDDCGTNSCQDCRPAGDGCSVGLSGRLSCTFPASGAHFRFLAGGAGGTGLPWAGSVTR